MNSSYFADKVRFNPNPYLFDDGCKFHEVSFLTDKAKTKVGKFPYYEWMLTCVVSLTADPQNESKYFLSRAYHSHHVLVYGYNEQNGWTIDSISARISVIIDDGAVITGESSPPTLVDLLKNHRSPTTASGTPIEEEASHVEILKENVKLSS